FCFIFNRKSIDMKALSESEVLKKLEDLEGWELQDDALHCRFEFENFKEAFSAMTRIAFEAERLHRDPEWNNVYNILEIYLSTHDANGITDKDFELAEIIYELVG